MVHRYLWTMIRDRFARHCHALKDRLHGEVLGALPKIDSAEIQCRPRFSLQITAGGPFEPPAPPWSRRARIASGARIV